MDNINWTDNVIAICTIISTIATVLGAIFVVIQIRSGTKAQQDKKAPLLVLNGENNAVSNLQIKNIGELSSIIFLICINYFTTNGKKIKEKLQKQIIIEKDDSQKLISLKETINTDKDLITKMTLVIKYKSPLNDRTRKLKTKYERS